MSSVLNASDSQENPNSSESRRKLVSMINDKSLPWEERDEAKNQLLLHLYQSIRQQLFGFTKGRIGIEDRLSGVANSAIGHIKEQLSAIAEAVDDEEVVLEAAICRRLRFWAIDKIRRSDGQLLITGKGREKQPATALDAVPGAMELPEDVAIREEGLALLKASVFSAVAALEGIEQAVVISRFALEGGEKRSIDEVAKLLRIPPSMANNAYRRAKAKLKKWLSDFEQDE